METLKSLAAGLGLLVVLALPLLGITALVVWVPWLGWTIVGALMVGLFALLLIVVGDDVRGRRRE